MAIQNKEARFRRVFWHSDSPDGTRFRRFAARCPDTAKCRAELTTCWRRPPGHIRAPATLPANHPSRREHRVDQGRAGQLHIRRCEGQRSELAGRPAEKETNCAGTAGLAGAIRMPLQA
jgi:hypothetical protein